MNDVMTRRANAGRSVVRGMAVVLAIGIPSIGCADRNARDWRRFEDLFFSAPPPISPESVVRFPAPPAVVADMSDVRPVFRIGAIHGEEEVEFSRVASLAVSGTGDTILVADAGQREIRAFSRSGEFLFRSGRRGRGPGEYEEPAAVQVLPWNGQIAVWDAGLNRITLLAPGGEVLRTIRLEGRTAGTVALRLARTGQALRSFRDGFIYETRSDPLRVSPEHQRGYLVRLDTMGIVRDTILDFPVPPIPAAHREGTGGGWSSFEEPLFFLPVAQWDVRRDGTIAFAAGGVSTWSFYSADGKPLLGVTVPSESSPVTRKDRVRLLEYRIDELSTAKPLLPTALLEIRMRHRFVTRKPAIADVLLGSSGQLWIQVFDTRDHPAGRSRRWWIYDSAEGDLVEARLPPGLQPMAIHGDLVVGIRTDSLGVNYVVGYPVPRSNQDVLR